MSSMKLGLLLCAVLTVVGCGGARKNIRPPKTEEELVAPPPDDKRYMSSVRYPKGDLNRPLIKRASSTNGGPSRLPRTGAPGVGTRALTGGY